MNIPRIYICDSVTKLTNEMSAAVVIAASHGGTYSALLAAKFGTRGVILNDAGIGRDQAGIAGLHILNNYNIAAATVSHRSARIGDGQDVARRGLISHANPIACALGIKQGMPAISAAEAMKKNDLTLIPSFCQPVESRVYLSFPNAKRKVVLVDSASLVNDSDRGAIVITGSHGGLLGGNPSTAIKTSVFAALYNDAGIGVDSAGISRLTTLDTLNIAGATVSADSALIGSAHSTYEQGIVSTVNRCAQAYGIHTGMSSVQFVDILHKLENR